MDSALRTTLLRAAHTLGTPAYVYQVDGVIDRFDRLAAAFGDRFAVSYAVKSNPNAALMRRLADRVATFDVSSIGEVERVLAMGEPADRLTFSGPAKRDAELRRAVEVGVGEMVCESADEAARLNALASVAGRRQSVLLRINPMRMPAGFGVNMAGKPSQFGVDEEDAGAAIDAVLGLPSLDLIGLHIYSGTNCLRADAIAENFAIFIDLFGRLAATHDLSPRKLIFGSGFGIPYLPDEKPLDLDDLATRVNPMIDQLASDPRLGAARRVLEMGRWLVGPHGYLLTRVVAAKRSRGADIRLLDAGFNTHLAACGMMGTVIRRNWNIANLSADPAAESRVYQLVGPLCTTIDQVARDVQLPTTEPGDVIAIGSSGAYGLTSSPIGFISHPTPREALIEGVGPGARIIDADEPVEPQRVRPAVAARSTSPS